MRAHRGIGIAGVLRRLLAAAISATGALFAASATAATVAIFILAPQPPSQMGNVELDGSMKPVFLRDFQIPYDMIETAARAEIAKQIATLPLTGHDPCLEGLCTIDWKVTLTPGFAFTQKTPPVVTAGPAGQNVVNVSVNTQVRLTLTASVHATAGIIGSLDAAVNADVIIGISAGLKLAVWPSVVSQGVTLDLTLVSSNIGLKSFNANESTIATALVGPIDKVMNALVPKLVPLAKSKLNAAAAKAISAQLAAVEKQARPLMTAALQGQLDKVNNIRDAMLNTKLPVVNQSYQQLSAALGLDFNVQTASTAKGLNVIVTPRFAAAAGSGKLTGELRMAKADCLYVKNGRGSVPVGLKEINQDLKAKVGQACSAVIPATALTTSAYLGASPAAISGATALASWKPSGTVTFTGNVQYVTGGAPYKPTGSPGATSQSTDYYACSFQIGGLPTADIVEVKPGAALVDRVPGAAGIKLRGFEASAAGASTQLNANWALAPSFVIGSAGSCGAGSLVFATQPNLRDKFDPEKCPSCGIQRQNGVLLITNPAPLYSIPGAQNALDSAPVARFQAN